MAIYLFISTDGHSSSTGFASKPDTLELRPLHFDHTIHGLLGPMRRVSLSFTLMRQFYHALVMVQK